MDCDVAKYGIDRFNEIKDEMIGMLAKVGWKKQFIEDHVPVLPLSGFRGDNLINKSTNMDWWKGTDVKSLDKSKTHHIDTLLDALENFVELPVREGTLAMRTPISGVYKIKGTGDVLTGRVEQGTVKPGDEVKFLPTHTAANACTGKIFTVEMHHKTLPEAGAGLNVGFNVKGLNKNNMPRVGDIMVLKSDNTLGAAKSFTCQVKILTHPGELKVGYSPIAFVRTARSAVKMAKIEWKIGKATGGKKLEDPPFVKANEMAQLVFEPLQPFVVASFKDCEGLGRVAIMEGNSVVMLGKCIAVEVKADVAAKK
jgi:elongation factor 1-alpha